MNWGKAMNFIGLGLLGLCFFISLGRVVTRTKQMADPDHVKIRFAHWQLEGSLREAFDAIVSDYEKLHPGVQVEQMAIPEKIAKNWARTQLVGGTAPDIIQLGSGMGTNEEILARYFKPLGAEVDQPNPYNAGTDLAGVPWRETFIDGLSSTTNYSAALLDYFGVPNSMFTFRMYYNRDLWKAVTGDAPTPENFEDFVEICRRTSEYRLPGGERLLPIAGSKYNAPYVMNALFESQTQKLRLSLDSFHNLAPSGSSIALSYLEDKWSWDTPGVQSGLELMARAGKHMQAGFLSLGRDDALFYFAQQRALMISTGSWDASSLRVQVPFDMGVFRIPLPSPDDPKYGEFVQGRTSEAGAETSTTFGITKESKHPEVALDFLHFLTSKNSNAKFSKLSGWLPSVVGVPLGEDIAPFEPITEGYTTGFAPDLGIGANTSRLFNNNLYELVGPNGSVSQFSSRMKAGYKDALLADLRLSFRNQGRSAAAKDLTIGTHQMIERNGGADAGAAAERVSQHMEAQSQQEAGIYYMNYKLRQPALRP